MTRSEAPSKPRIRLDKWLDIACLFKTRSQAKEACEKGRVRVNGKASKPKRLLYTGEQIEIRQSDWTRIVEVLQIPPRAVSRSVARTLYEDHTPPRAKLDPVQRIMQQSPAQRPQGLGRPTKRARRQQERLKGR